MYTYIFFPKFFFYLTGDRGEKLARHKVFSLMMIMNVNLKVIEYVNL